MQHRRFLLEIGQSVLLAFVLHCGRREREIRMPWRQADADVGRLHLRMLVQEITERDQFGNAKRRCRVGVHLLRPASQLIKRVENAVSIESRRLCAGDCVAGLRVSPNAPLARYGFGIAEHLQRRRDLLGIARFDLQDVGEAFRVPEWFCAHLFDEAEKGRCRHIEDSSCAGCSVRFSVARYRPYGFTQAASYSLSRERGAPRTRVPGYLRSLTTSLEVIC